MYYNTASAWQIKWGIIHKDEQGERDNTMIAMHCVIFAGGKSSRMGENKALLPFGGYDSLLQYQYSRMRTIFDRVSISLKEGMIPDFPCTVIEDRVKENIFAPTAGFVALFDVLQEERIFVLSVDTPFVSKTELMALLSRDRREHDATVARTLSGVHPMCGIYHRSLHQTFRRMLDEGDHRLRKMLQASQTCWVDFDQEAAFANLNYPHEYEAALQRLKQEGMLA